jgi:Tfp pilus assembly protein PilF
MYRLLILGLITVFLTPSLSPAPAQSDDVDICSEVIERAAEEMQLPTDATSAEITILLSNDRGLDFLASGQYDQAIIAFNLAVETDPAYADTYLYRGCAYLLADDQTNAQSDFGT